MRSPFTWLAGVVISLALYLPTHFGPARDYVFSERIQQHRAAGHFFIYERTFGVFYRVETCDEKTNPKNKNPLVLLHGFPTSSLDWTHMISDLCAIGTQTGAYDAVLMFDFLGYGLSDKPRNHNYSIMEQANITQALLQFLFGSPARGGWHFLAHDYGVSVLQELLARDKDASAAHPVLVKSAAFLNGGLFTDVYRPLFIQKVLTTPMLGPLASRFMSFFTFSRSFPRIFGPDTQPSLHDLEDHWALIETGGGAANSHALLAYIDERKLFSDRWSDALQPSARKNPPPQIFINGELDPVSGKHMADAYAERVPHGMLVRLEKTGHYPQNESPHDVLQGFSTFMAKVAKKQQQ